MKVKKIFLKLDDGRIYSIPAHVIAHNRATYYAQKDKDTTYQEEYDFAMRDSYELNDWLWNNMNWYEHGPTLEKEAKIPDLKDAVIDESWTAEG